MADIALTAAQIAPVFPDNAEIYSMILAETVTKGLIVFLDSNGKAQLADANAGGEEQVRGVALEGGGAGQVISIMKRGHIYGFTVSGMAYDASAYLSDTVGVLADAAGTMTVPVGIIVPLTDGTSLTKVLYLDIRWREDWT